MAKPDFKKVLIIVCASLLLGLTYNYFSPEALPLFGFSIKKYVSDELLRSEGSMLPEAEPRHISLKEALRLYEAHVTFIDAREEPDFQAGHIGHAINIPYDRFNKYQEILKSIPKDEPVVSYCGGSDCELSIMLGNKLASMGYNKVFIFFGGWNAWADAKYPIGK
ncbi:MAG: rhodanese-like domain-containing protein [Ignavibacteria bacterium]|jgi:rhodanese-related sulfurtransferase|nr:rhodanese-like domain-containing protein [Ignavibacteria bacterium]MCU7502901.1 rhodanese-like domain-containing protein [Ignavibacteria bacterium]MCU7515605.1 rhodanese-like domain-containing protein [Ignavibacteria bacterium]